MKNIKSPQNELVIPSLDVVVNRYNDAISDLVEYNSLVINGETKSAQRCLRNAGESLSQALELALHLHCYNHDSEMYVRLYQKSPAPKIIEERYFDKNRGVFIHNGLDSIVGVDRVTVDFVFLSSNKYFLTNYAKHQGGNPRLDIINQYKVEVKKFINEYIDRNAALKDEAYYCQPQFDMVQQFYSACEKFRSDERRFILLVDGNSSSSAMYRNFNRVKWDLVIEFNPHSIENGFTFVALRGKTPSHIFTTADQIGEDSIPRYSETPILFFANGFHKVAPIGNTKDWNRMYGKKVTTFVERYASVASTQQYIVVSLMTDMDKLSLMINTIGGVMDNVRFVVANDVERKLEIMCSLSPYSSDIVHLPISMNEIDTCLNEFLLDYRGNDYDAEYKLPCLSKEVNGLIPKVDVVQLDEYFEVLYEGVDVGEDDSEMDYLSGMSVLSWEGAKRKFAAEKSKARTQYYKTVDDLLHKGRGLLTIVHEPGFGGTTVARQIAYYFHHDYPVLILKQYNQNKVRELLSMVYKYTKKTIMVIMDIPMVISMEDMNNLYHSINPSLPYLFIGVKRGTSKSASGSLVVNDWGNDVVLLKDKFLPYINQFPDEVKNKKLCEIDRILHKINIEPYKRTPFYFGWLAFEDKFMAMRTFIHHFVKSVKQSEPQRKTLIYLAIVEKFIGKGLPDSFLRTCFNVAKNAPVFKLEQFFNEEDGVIQSLLTTKYINGQIYRRLKYPYFAEDLLKMLLTNQANPSNTLAYMNLGTYCKSLIEDVANSLNSEILQDSVLKDLFIGSSTERSSQKFTCIFDKIQKEDRVNIFILLHELFPNNPHFASHLARYYSIVEKNMPLALEYADKAISLSSYPDPLLHHIKGMCLFSLINSKINEMESYMHRGIEPAENDVYEVTDTLLNQVCDEFKLSRELYSDKNHRDEYGYIPNIQVLLRVFDFYVKATHTTKLEVISMAKTPYFDWLEEAQSLLDEAKRMYAEGEESERYLDVEVNVWEQYGVLNEIISKLNNKLEKAKNPAIIRRQLVRLYMKKDDSYKTTVKDNNRIIRLMEENIILEPTNEKNIYLWFQAARYSILKSDELLTKAMQWRSLNGGIEISFYCYILQVIKALNGSTEAAVDAVKLGNECKRLGCGDFRVREWYSNDGQHFMSNAEYQARRDMESLKLVSGRVSRFVHAGAANITLDCGLDVFFRPTDCNLSEDCLNHLVEFRLGFSYDGLRALDNSVKRID